MKNILIKKITRELNEKNLIKNITRELNEICLPIKKDSRESRKPKTILSKRF